MNFFLLFEEDTPNKEEDNQVFAGLCGAFL